LEETDESLETDVAVPCLRTYQPNRRVFWNRRVTDWASFGDSVLPPVGGGFSSQRERDGWRSFHCFFLPDQPLVRYLPPAAATFPVQLVSLFTAAINIRFELDIFFGILGEWVCSAGAVESVLAWEITNFGVVISRSRRVSPALSKIEDAPTL